MGTIGSCVTKRRYGRPVDRSRKEGRKLAKAHAQASNVSPRTKANNATTQRQTAQHDYASPYQQPAYQGAEHAPPQDHHVTRHATKVTPVDKQGPAPAEARVGTASDGTQIRNRGAGAGCPGPQKHAQTPRRRHTRQQRCWGAAGKGAWVEGALRRMSVALCKGNDFLISANLHAFCWAAGKHPKTGAPVPHTIEV